MKIHVKKTWAAAVGLALAASTVGGVAIAAGDASGWYTGGNATVVDPDKTAVALKLYDASGNQVSTGSTTTQLAAFAAADAPVRAGDDFASLFVHLPQSSTAPGGWPGVQVTGTSRFSGPGAVSAPAALAGKPYVATTAQGYTLADVVAGLPNKETGASYANVYELRLRSSSAAGGVSNQYAAAYVKISGTTWTLTSSPVLGDSSIPTTTPTPKPTAVGTSVTVTWPKISYGKAAAVKVTVKAASGTAKPSGTVTLLNGSRKLGSATLSSGAATLTVARTALAPGSRSLKVTYAGVPNAFVASQSAAKTIKVAKGATGRPTLKVTKKPTAKKAGAATIKVPTSKGLAKAGGKVQVILKKGKTAKKLKAVKVRSGAAKVTLPKLPKGTWVVTVVYLGDSHYVAAKSKAIKLQYKK